MLVNVSDAAGGAESLDAIAEPAWDRVFTRTLKPALLCARAAVPHLRSAGSGRIVSLGPPGSGLAAGAAAGALDALTRLLAQELASAGICVNTVHPAPLRDELPPLPGRLAPEEEVAEAVAFLCSDAAGAITGESIRVAGLLRKQAVLS
jgi:NAD(P)-dependent dehydrogenase (short-subunit alcohol dehydrogenase family)